MAFSVAWTYQLIDRYSGPIRKVQKATDRARQSMKKAQKATAKFGSSMATMQTGVASLAGMLGGAMMLNTFTDFESVMNRVQGVTKSTDAEFVQLRNSAKALGITTRFSATQAANGIEMLGKNGLIATQIMNGAIGATLKLSSATGADLATSADIATDVMANFNKKSSDLLRIVDKISGVTINSKFNINDYRLALGQAGGVAGEAGVSLRDFNTSLAAMAPLFASGSDAGTAFKTFLVSLAPQSKSSAKMMKMLNLEFFDSSGKMKGMSTIAGILNRTFSNLTDKQKTLAAQTMFGRDAMRAAFGLAKIGEKQFINLANSIDKVSATKLAQDRMRGLSGVILVMKSAWEGLQIAIFDSGFADDLVVLFTKFSGFLRKIAAANPKLLKFVAIAGGLALALAPVLLTVGFMASGVSALIGVFSALAGVFSLILAPIGLVGGFLILIAAATVKAFVSNSKLHTSLVGLYKALSPVIDLFKLLWNWVGGTDVIVGTLVETFNTLSDIIGGVLAFAIGALSAAIEVFLVPLKLAMMGMNALFGDNTTNINASGTSGNINGKIEVSASPGSKVNRTEMNTNMPGNLGMNMWGEG